ncbi:uncharacterized protein N7483_007444 [Penicillium malachiteum]|uniref:uncharacterized protein n=1 Tax=Penicillium malachiteum TaxID=1324776 RepID=UPI00254809FE|nr:uncharacterized protein N7483_007444 [Penicillium malachiteum]KAJ5726087.1 hypothetical protein N7483_007444 [Penicillium malachiteum]
MDSSVNALDYLRSKTQVDLDDLDVEVAKRGAMGRPFTDATSNQVFPHAFPLLVLFQVQSPANAELVQRTLSITNKLHPIHPSLTFEELAVEVAAVHLATRVLPYISGRVHVMANPCYSFDTPRIIEAGKRYHSLFRFFDTQCNLNRVVMKVPATWEGLQACKTLTTEGIQTLATTVFSMEQCILAGEAGCLSVSPFIHDLKKLVCPSYKDENPVIELCVQAQMYYKSHNIPTRVKACSSGSLDEILQLAGVDSHTLESIEIDALAKEWRDRNLLHSVNLFEAPNMTHHGTAEYPSYANNEARFRVDLSASKGGMSQLKLYRAIDIFCDYQKKVEEFLGSINGSS